MLIAQLTDTHITCDGEQARYLAETIAWLNRMQPQPAAVLVSGDTTNTGRREEYAVLRDLLARCDAPVYVIPGNHDRRGPLRAVLPPDYFPGVHGERLHYCVDTGGIRMIGLDTSEPHRLGGFLDTASLEWFDAAVDARPTLVFMHHPPFRTGVNAADMLGFAGLRRLRQIIARRRSVLRIIAGHIHCERRADISQALATTSLSTTPQRVPELFERHLLALRPEAPGFSVHVWRDGAFASTTFVNTAGGRFVERAVG